MVSSLKKKKEKKNVVSWYPIVDLERKIIKEAEEEKQIENVDNNLRIIETHI